MGIKNRKKRKFRSAKRNFLIAIEHKIVHPPDFTKRKLEWRTAKSIKNGFLYPEEEESIIPQSEVPSHLDMRAHITKDHLPRRQRLKKYFPLVHESSIAAVEIAGGQEEPEEDNEMV
eukprot:Trichotokara_eunicae@DN3186_c0_g1_i1.p1